MIIDSIVRMRRVESSIFRSKEFRYCKCVGFDNEFLDVKVFCECQAITQTSQLGYQRVCVPNFSGVATDPGATRILNDASCSSTTRVAASRPFSVQLKKPGEGGVQPM